MRYAVLAALLLAVPVYSDPAASRPAASQPDASLQRMVHAMQAQIAELKDENRKLRVEVQKLADENAKLRPKAAAVVGQGAQITVGMSREDATAAAQARGIVFDVRDTEQLVKGESVKIEQWESRTWLPGFAQSVTVRNGVVVEVKK